MQDEGVGVRAVEWLQAHCVAPDVQMLDGGTMGLDLLHYLEDVDHLIVLDAVNAGKTPGEVIVLTGDDIPAFIGMKVSPHQIGIQDLLATAQLMGYTPPEVVVLGVQPAAMSVGLEMSPAVATQVEPLARLAIAQLEQWGYQLSAASE
jgi:hydrogenase maturation protease